MRKSFFGLLLLVSIIPVYAKDFTVTIKVNNILVSSGNVFITIFNSETTYKKGVPSKKYILQPTNEVLTFTEQIPEGDYVISAYQDVNNNNTLDTNIIGIPKEPAGISNYDGKSIPGGFEKLKIQVFEDNQQININIVKL